MVVVAPASVVVVAAMVVVVAGVVVAGAASVVAGAAVVVAAGWAVSPSSPQAASSTEPPAIMLNLRLLRVRLTIPFCSLSDIVSPWVCCCLVVLLVVISGRWSQLSTYQLSTSSTSSTLMRM